MASRKVAFTTPAYFDEDSYVGGGERYAFNLARGIVEVTGGDYEVEIISFGRSPLSRTLGRGLTLRILPVAYCPKIYLDATSWDLAAAIADVDLVHVHAPMTRSGEVAILAAKQQQKPLFITDHGGQNSTIAEELGSLDLADRIICYSDFGASLYRTRSPVTIIKGGVDTAQFRAPERRPPRDRMLYVGRLLPHKGIDRLISALSDGIPLTVCGRPYHDDYHRHLRGLAADKQVDFITDASDETLCMLYSRAWATILPSTYLDCYGQVCPVPELMGLSLVESMACGTPAIGARVGGIPEFIREGETGFLFDTKEELADLLRRLYTDLDLVERIGRRAREVVLKEYDAKVAAARLVELYEGALKDVRGEAA